MASRPGTACAYLELVGLGLHMVALISALAWLLTATGLVLIGIFLNRMVKPLSSVLIRYCERNAANSVVRLLEHLTGKPD